MKGPSLYGPYPGKPKRDIDHAVFWACVGIAAGIAIAKYIFGVEI